jgi:hypothetical protein
VFRIPQLPEIMSEAEDYLVKITGWGGALCPSFTDRQPRVPRGAGHRLVRESVCVRTSEQAKTFGTPVTELLKTVHAEIDGYDEKT